MWHIEVHSIKYQYWLSLPNFTNSIPFTSIYKGYLPSNTNHKNLFNFCILILLYSSLSLSLYLSKKNDVKRNVQNCVPNFNLKYGNDKLSNRVHCWRHIRVGTWCWLLHLGKWQDLQSWWQFRWVVASNFAYYTFENNNQETIILFVCVQICWIGFLNL